VNGLGKRQRRMLTDMLIFGDGKWPKDWHFRHDHGEIMTTLWFRGYTTESGQYASLTDHGRVAAAALHGDRTVTA